jgi:hypothetical protein
MLSSVCSFIWVKGGMHSYILSVMPLHGHKQITDHWWYFTFSKLLRQGWNYISVSMYFTHRNCSLVYEGKGKRSTIRCLYNSQYIINRFLQSSCVSRAREMLVHEGRLSRHRGCLWGHIISCFVLLFNFIFCWCGADFHQCIF